MAGQKQKTMSVD